MLCASAFLILKAIHYFKQVTILMLTVASVYSQEEPSLVDKLWELPQVYEDEENSYFQEFEYLVYAQPQVAWVDSNNGYFEDSGFRRFRIGTRTRFLREWYMFNLIDVDPLDGPFYENITLAYLTWSPYGNSVADRKKFQISGGKQKVNFTREFTQSPKIIKTVERSMLVNYHFPQFATGGWVSGSLGDNRYMVAVFSGDKEEEFSRFEDGGLCLVKLSKDIGEDWNVDLDLVLADDEQEIISGIKWGFSFSAEFNPDYSNGNFYFMGDLIATGGRVNQGDTYGIVLMPAWQLHKKLELVSRLQLASSSEVDGLRLQKYYERLPGDFRGENYVAGYAGLNYFIRGHNLKVMGGIEYSKMDPGIFDGHTWFLALRTWF